MALLTFTPPAEAVATLKQFEAGMISFTEFAITLKDQHRIHVTGIQMNAETKTMTLDLTRDCFIDDETLDMSIETALLTTNYKL